jgi:hypothetical protein
VLCASQMVASPKRQNNINRLIDAGYFAWLNDIEFILFPSLRKLKGNYSFQMFGFLTVSEGR